MTGDPRGDLPAFTEWLDRNNLRPAGPDLETPPDVLVAEYLASDHALHAYLTWLARRRGAVKDGLRPAGAIGLYREETGHV